MCSNQIRAASPYNQEPAAPLRVVQYVRMSTDYQKYSIANQSEANQAYALNRGMEIVRTYADKGKSGLRLEGRNALLQLIEDVQTGKADFKAILVYDVTRWGRFQNVDESAHYEYLCKLAGINVHYCAEQFENDGSPLSAIVKSIKRAMAGEYSRELSTKVFAGHRRLIRLGYRQGGSAGFGLRRLLVDQTGVTKIILGRGERKSILTDRVVLVPGPPEELAVVRWIFSSFVKMKMLETEIARSLNRRKILNVKGKSWNFRHVRAVLTNENYIGSYVWNRYSFKLGRKRTNNQPEQWVRAEGVFEAIVDRRIFEEAQSIICYLSARPWRSVGNVSRGLSDEELLNALRRLLQERGKLTRRIIDESPGVPCSETYDRRFGGLMQAYDLIGHTGSTGRPPQEKRGSNAVTHRLSEEQLLDALRQLLRDRGYLTKSMIDRAEGMPCGSTYQDRFESLTRAYRLVGFKQFERRRPHPAALQSKNANHGCCEERQKGNRDDTGTSC